MDNALMRVSYLESEGFRTVAASDGDTALTHLAMLKPDLVLLDVRMPNRDGFEVLASIRRDSAVPAIRSLRGASSVTVVRTTRIMPPRQDGVGVAE
jgi:CheY-like chemotaxis protein